MSQSVYCDFCKEKIPSLELLHPHKIEVAVNGIGAASYDICGACSGSVFTYNDHGHLTGTDRDAVTKLLRNLEE